MEIDEGEIINMNNNCPECKEEAVTTCRCLMADSTCRNGHNWHTCVVHEVKVKGHGCHKGDTYKCTCGRGYSKNGVIEREI